MTHDETREVEDKIATRVELLIRQARINAATSGGGGAKAAADMLTAFVLLCRQEGAPPDKAIEAMLEDAKNVVEAFWNKKGMN